MREDTLFVNTAIPKVLLPCLFIQSTQRRGLGGTVDSDKSAAVSPAGDGERGELSTLEDGD